VSSRLRISALAVIALVALPVLSACSTSPGAAAVIGSQRITTGMLQSQVDESLAGGQVQKQQGFDRASFTRNLLGHMINVDLLNAAAAAHHVTVSNQDISAQLASFQQQAGGAAALQTQAANGGVTAKQLPAFVRFAALQQKLTEALIANLTATPAQLTAEYKKDIDQYDQLKVAQIAVKSKTLADQILTKVRNDPSLFASLAEKDSLDTTTKSKGGLVGYVGRTQVQSVLGGATAPVKPGTFEIAHSSGDYVVIHIIARHVEPQSAVTSQLKSSLFAAQGQTLLTKTISAEATKLGVHVSPRYGRWDSATSAVVAVKSPVSSPASTSPSSAG
jgi:hypothetical protein